jgi:hypothetical protein
MQVLSRDSVTVSVDAVVYYRVKNPIMATNNVEDYRLAPITTKQKSYRYKFATPIHELKQQKKNKHINKSHLSYLNKRKPYMIKSLIVELF